MSWDFLLSFGIGLGVYLLVVGLVVLVKHIKNKRKVQEDIKKLDNNEEEHKD